MIDGSTKISDHCPLILKKLNSQKFPGFRFEAWWATAEGFKETIDLIWNKPFYFDHIRRLHIKLTRMTKGLGKWSKHIIKERRLAADIASEVIF